MVLDFKIPIPVQTQRLKDAFGTYVFTKGFYSSGVNCRFKPHQVVQVLFLMIACNLTPNQKNKSDMLIFL